MSRHVLDQCDAKGGDELLEYPRRVRRIVRLGIELREAPRRHLDPEKTLESARTDRDP